MMIDKIEQISCCIVLQEVLLSGYNWSILTNHDTPECDSGLCQNDGECLPGQGVRPGSPAGTVACLCKPGFKGPNCGTRMSSCAENPCHNGANCIEDPSGGTGYYCSCENTGYRGRHCELEPNTQCHDACRNDGVCLRQPGGFLCECPANYGGMRCDNPRMPVRNSISLFFFFFFI